ncbi:DNA repair protein REV1 [Alosa sapidissima]|uniref:DNA repair protein REV1 n=1 Tax=Alosa sapidissima TaxID=34773 RepID=UPI001C08605A|nr:DNA repair protein REV1 [Alosa sapidissima]XP_041940095.1 DNA repair protein REV1 [Alosa sapidissima]
MSRDGWRKKASSDDGWGGRGGYMAAKVCKLEEQFQLDAPREKQKEGGSSSIFSGVAIYVNGYTEPSADELRRLMMLHGGQFHVYYSHSKTTHIIATNLPNSKISQLRSQKVVRPEWITDSIKAGRQLSYLQYQLYAKQKGLSFPSVCLRKLDQQELAGASGHHQSSSSSVVCREGLPVKPSRGPPKPSHASPGAGPPLLQEPLAEQSQVSPRPVSSDAAHGHKELELRVNGSLQNPKGGGIRLNGLHGEDQWEEHSSTSGRAKESTLTNGHVHPFNGALKPTDMSLHPGGLTQEAQPEQRDSMSTVSPERSPYYGPRTPSPIPPQQPRVSPVTQHKHNSDSPNTQRQVPPPASPTNQNASTSSDLTPARPHPPDQGSRGVRLNGSHHSSGPSHNHTHQDLSDQSGKPATRGAEGGIISEFYSYSRLHHISTWRSEFAEYVNSLQCRRRATGGAVFSGKERLKKLRAQRSSGLSSMPAPQVRQSCILHVDMDCFFVSVGIRHRPDLKGKPVAVTSNRGPGRVAQRPGANPQLEFQYYQHKRNQHQQKDKMDGDLEMTPSPEDIDEHRHGNGMDQDQASLSMAEIASCSYEARQAGVKNGMFFGQAKKLCPELKAVPYDFQAYKEVALVMYETLASFTHHIEALSCDEALLDATALLAEVGVTPDELASAIRADVMEKTGCSASVGMGSNILLARMATRRAKPEGQYLLRSEDVDDFISDQAVTSLPGVGRSMGSKLASLGVTSCGDLQQVSMARLQREFGPRTGQTLFRFCRGLDDRPVRSEKERKSVSAEMNYNIRFTKVEDAESFLSNLSMEVQKRLQGAGLKGRRVTLKVMMRKPGAPVEPAKYGGHGICDNLARSVTLGKATDSGQLIAQEAIKLFHAMRLEVSDMRGVGLQVQLLDGGPQVQAPPQDSRCSIRDLLLARRPPHTNNTTITSTSSSTPAPSTARPDADAMPSGSSSGSSSNQDTRSSSMPPPTSFSDPIPSTSKGEPPPHTPNHARSRLNLSIEVPSPSQVDRSVLEALPPELRQQVERTWSRREENEEQPGASCSSPVRPPPPRASACASPPPPEPPPPPGTLLLQIPNQMGSTGIILALPDFSQVDPEVFAALPKELQDELCSAYNRRESAQPQGTEVKQKNPLLQLKQPAAGRTKRRYKKRDASPAKKGPSPLKRLHPATSPAKSSPSKPTPPPFRLKDDPSGLKTENGPSSSSMKPDVPEVLSKFTPRPAPTLAGASELSDIRTLLREWVTTISEPMEEDILQVVKYCTELVEDKDLEKLDIIIKYMKRLMQQSVESVWSMAFDFIVDNVQVVVQQTYGSTLKIT